MFMYNHFAIHLTLMIEIGTSTLLQYRIKIKLKKILKTTMAAPYFQCNTL